MPAGAGDTRDLVQLCAGYWGSYVLTGAGFFAVDPVSASLSMIVIVATALVAGSTDPRIVELDRAISHLEPIAILSGVRFLARAERRRSRLRMSP